MRCVFAILALALVGCGSAGDSLVVVTVDANPPLANIALLHTTSMAGGVTMGHDFMNIPSLLGGGMMTTFGVQVPSSISGPFTIHVEADDAIGNRLASGDGATTLARGKRVNLVVTLGQSLVDLGGSTADIGGPMVDLGRPTVDAGPIAHVCVVSTDTFDDGCVLAP